MINRQHISESDILTVVNQQNIALSDTIYVAKNGDDATGTGSVNKPYLTVQRAFNDLAAGLGKAIIVGPGDYDETAVLTVGADTPALWSLVGLAGSWTTNIRAVKVDATASYAASMIVHFENWVSLFPSRVDSDPCIEIETSASFPYFHLDTTDMYLNQHVSGSAGIKASGVAPSNYFGLRLVGTTVYTSGANVPAIDSRWGILQLASSHVDSSVAPEIVSSTGITAEINGSIVGRISGTAKTEPTIYLHDSGTGGKFVIGSSVAGFGVNNFLDVEAGSGSVSIVLSELVAIRGGAGGVSNPTGAVVQGSFIDALTGVEIPVSAGMVIPFKKAASTGYDNTSSGLAATNVQNAIDELAPVMVGNSLQDLIYVSKSGNDSTGTGAINKPYLTVQKAFDDIAAGNAISVFVGPGDYDETAVLTVGADTPTGFSMIGSGTWSTNVRGIKIDASSAPDGRGYNLDTFNFSSHLSSTDPNIELVAKSTLGHFHLDAENMYMSGSAAGVAAVKFSGDKCEDAGIRLKGCTTFVSGENACCLDLPFGICQMINGGFRSTNGPEVKTTTEASYLITTGFLLGEGNAGTSKTYPNVAVTNNGESGLIVMLNSTQCFVGSGHVVDVSVNTGSCTVVTSEVIVMRNGTGGFHNPTGAVVLGNTIDGVTMQEIPATSAPGYLFCMKKAASTSFDISGGILTSTNVQGAIDELAARVYALENPE